MKVCIESIGGFAGREMVLASYDTEDLPAGEAAEAHRAVARLAAAAARGDTGEVGADLPGYRVTADGETFEVTGAPLTELATLLRS